MVEDFDQVLSQTRQRTTIGAHSVRRLQDALAAFLSTRGADLAYARRLPDLLRDAAPRRWGRGPDDLWPRRLTGLQALPLSQRRVATHLPRGAPSRPCKLPGFV